MYKLHGLISTAMILDGMLGLERIEFERLDEMKVEQVMKKDIPVLKLEDSFAKALEMTIDHPFICAVNEDGYFEGF